MLQEEREDSGRGGTGLSRSTLSPPADFAPTVGGKGEGEGRLPSPVRHLSKGKKRERERERDPPAGGGVVSREEREGMEKTGGRAGWPPSVLDPHRSW